MRARTLQLMALAGVLALACLVFGGGSRASAQIIDCTNGSPGPNMTIVIINNSSSFNIYPVLFAGAKSDTDQWMQACFKIPYNKIEPTDNYPYPRASQYRIYVNCCAAGENGIPPKGGSVTIKLPFYSPLVKQISPKGTAQFIDWWQGGGINVYRGASSSTTPPAILQSHWAADNSKDRGVKPQSNPPTCGAGCTLHFFVTPNSIANWEPQQLIEYTLGAAPEDTQRASVSDPFYLWVPDNVDYDVSNVNYAYMPGAIEPYGNSLNGTCCAIGWVGSTDSIETVSAALDNWRASSLGSGWPFYVDQSSTTNPKATVPGKVPSALEIFLNYNSFNNTSNYSPAPSNSAPLVRMKALWEDCATGGKKYDICGRIKDVTALMQANYDNYASVYKSDKNTWNNVWKCKTPPVTLTAQIMLAHLYGWGPFNADSGCAANVNLLEQTPGYTDPTKAPRYYADVKTEYDQLQYWYNVLNSQYGQWKDTSKPDYGQFDPYVGLVHGKEYMNAPYTYAYSVDDAVGNMQTDGTGLIVAIGGPQHLPNPNHVTPEVKFTFGYKSSYAGGITFAKYGRCVTAANTPTVSYYTTFVVPEGVDKASNSVTNCQITLKDSKNRAYTFKLKTIPSAFPTKPNPAPKIWPTTEQIIQWNPKYIDCTGNSNQDVLLSWCQNIYVYQQKDLTNPHLPINYYVIMGAPPPCDRNPSACPKQAAR
ncbi:MAG: hypothetical protein ACREE2_18585 [Stellaceae bacterium]